MRQYWLVNSGTTENPLTQHLIARYREWEATTGMVQGFPWRPTIAVGDVLIHRAVGSEGNRLVAVAEVIGEPSEVPGQRWPWRLPRRLTHVCTTLAVAPKALDLGVAAHGMRVCKRLSPETGSNAASAIRAVAQPYA